MGIGRFAQNPFMTQFGIEVPVVGASMSGASNAELAGAVARAGGFGFLGAGTPLSGLLQQASNFKQDTRFALALCRLGWSCVPLVKIGNTACFASPTPH